MSRSSSGMNHRGNASGEMKVDDGSITIESPRKDVMASPAGTPGDGKKQTTSKKKRSCRTPLQFMRALLDSFGGRFVAILAVNYFFVKGFNYAAINTAQLPLYKSINVDAVSYQKFYNIGAIGWSIKPLLGTLSDARPIFGYNKRYYLVIFSFLGALAMVIAQFLPRKEASAPLASILVFCASTAMAMLDLLCEGCYTKLMALKPESGSTVVTWVWLCYTTGGLVAACVEGPMADAVDPFYILLICVPMFLFMLGPSAAGWLPETKFRHLPPSIRQVEDAAADEQVAGELEEHSILEQRRLTNGGGSTTANPMPSRNSQATNLRADSMMTSGTAVRGSEAFSSPGDDSDELYDLEGEDAAQLSRFELCLRYCFPVLPSWGREQRRVVATGLLNGVLALGLAVVNVLNDDRYILLSYLVVILCIIMAAGYQLLPRAAFKVMCFLFFKELFYTHIRGILDYWYTADADCVPGGPAFSFTYYQTFGNVAATLSQLAAVLLFESILSKHKYRTVFYITTMLRMAAAVFDVVLIERWNLDIGIPDKVMWICGDQFVYQVCYMLDFMPAVVLMSRVCPHGVEATMFAVLAGLSNFGQSVSYSLGFMIAGWLGIQTPSGGDGSDGSTSDGSSTSPGCHFEALSTLVIMVHLLFPILIIPLIWMTMPADEYITKQQPSSEEEDDEEDVEGYGDEGAAVGGFETAADEGGDGRGCYIAPGTVTEGSVGVLPRDKSGDHLGGGEEGHHSSSSAPGQRPRTQSGRSRASSRRSQGHHHDDGRHIRAPCVDSADGSLIATLLTPDAHGED